MLTPPSIGPSRPSMIQRLFLSILPRRWGESMRRDSQAWRIRCCTCNYSTSVWDAGGIRWGAASVGKRIGIRCPQCGTLRAAAVEHVKAAGEDQHC